MVSHYGQSCLLKCFSKCQNEKDSGRPTTSSGLAREPGSQRARVRMDNRNPLSSPQQSRASKRFSLVSVILKSGEESRVKKHFPNNPFSNAPQKSCFYLNHPENTSVRFSTNDLGEAVLPRKCPLSLPPLHPLSTSYTQLNSWQRNTPPSLQLTAPLQSPEVTSGFKGVFLF